MTDENILQGWIETFKGHKFFVENPRPEDIDIHDIAHPLSNICRYNGHAKFFYSVAQHCCLLHDIIPEKGKKAILFHDASEAYICDIPSPIKPLLINYYALEKKIQDVIEKKFNVVDYDHELIKEYDNRILADEHLALFPNSPHKWAKIWEPLGVWIDIWSPRRAEREFLKRAEQYL